MSAGYYALTIEQGVDRNVPIAIVDDGVVRPLTGFTSRMQIRRKNAPTAETPLLDLTTANGRILIDATGGIVTLVFTAALTSPLTFTTAVYDLELIAPDGVVTRLLEGPATMKPEVTR